MSDPNASNCSRFQRRSAFYWFWFTSFLVLLPASAAQVLTSNYDPGNYTVTDLYLSPSGNDENSGTALTAPLRSLTAAWQKIPATTSTTGYRINFLAGTYPCEPLPEDTNNCQNYFSDRSGSQKYPIILQAYSGAKVIIRGGWNFNHVSYLYIYDLNLIGGIPLPTNSSGNNLFHLEQGDHVLLHGISLTGPSCDNDSCNNLQEVLKVNQTQYLYIEDSLISGAWHSAVDYFVVEYGHFLNNRVRIAGQWCMYVKGGTSYLQVAGNEFSGCLLGFSAGQADNLAVMKSPWVHYEVYDLKFVNNVLHDIPGTGFSATGAYNILFAYNTLYKVATSRENAYGLAQFTLGERNCTAIDEIPNVTDRCRLLTGQGAWGPIYETSDHQPLEAIPNRRVFVYNNIFYNPALTQSLYFQWAVNGAVPRPAGFANSPNPARTDDYLVLEGNIIWNAAGTGLPLFGSTGGGAVGCAAADSTCREELVIAKNRINQFEPQLRNPAAGDFRPMAGGNLLKVSAASIPAFAWDAFTPSVPTGTSDNTVPQDRAGNPRNISSPPGAYTGEENPVKFLLSLPILRR